MQYLCLLMMLTVLRTAHSESVTLAPSVAQYEEGLSRMIATEDPELQASAIRAMGQIASPRYAAARNTLMRSGSTIVLRALLATIRDMGDTSIEAREIVINCLNSDSPQLIQHAYEIVDYPIEFRSVWRKGPATFLWSKFAAAYGPIGFEFSGIAEAQPWRDPAWKSVPVDVQIDILAQAGSRKAVDLLRRQPELPQNMAMPESFDQRNFHELLKDKNPALRRYAGTNFLPVIEFLEHYPDSSFAAEAVKRANASFMEGLTNAELVTDQGKILPIPAGAEPPYWLEDVRAFANRYEKVSAKLAPQLKETALRLIQNLRNAPGK